MKITNIFDSARDGTFEDFIKFYNGNANEINENLGLNLLELALVNDKNGKEKIKIIQFLISEGVDINFVDTKHRRNALHTFYFNVLSPSSEYMLLVTKLLIENGIEINALDKYNAVPLKYAITITKLPTEEIKHVYQYLLEHGANYNNKDIFGKSCIDYIEEYSWRNNLIEIIKEFENGNN
ncbi:MAG TPA: ankyrin repeat domain-containing protein [Bacillus bacterium]|nr:ankyrin repeat domain-containing protein [Bacillus sp. (in: firmicutes)]